LQDPVRQVHSGNVDSVESMSAAAVLEPPRRPDHRSPELPGAVDGYQLSRRRARTPARRQSTRWSEGAPCGHLAAPEGNGRL